jgi:hypothetical protein
MVEDHLIPLQKVMPATTQTVLLIAMTIMAATVSHVCGLAFRKPWAPAPSGAGTRMRDSRAHWPASFPPNRTTSRGSSRLPGAASSNVG